jgi:hypothetical protein
VLCEFEWFLLVSCTNNESKSEARTEEIKCQKQCDKRIGGPFDKVTREGDDWMSIMKSMLIGKPGGGGAS